MGEDRWRLKQHGVPVAWADGNGAAREIAHYATVYASDGPVDIEHRANGRWRRVSPDHFRALLAALRNPDSLSPEEYLMDWQPIETAPKDGRIIIARRVFENCIIKRHAGSEGCATPVSIWPENHRDAEAVFPMAAPILPATK